MAREIGLSQRTVSGFAMSVMSPGVCQMTRAAAVPMTYRLLTRNFAERQSTVIQMTQYNTTKKREIKLIISRTLKKPTYCGKKASTLSKYKLQPTEGYCRGDASGGYFEEDRGHSMGADRMTERRIQSRSLVQLRLGEAMNRIIRLSAQKLNCLRS